MSILLAKLCSIKLRTGPTEARDVMSAATPLSFGALALGSWVLDLRDRVSATGLARGFGDWECTSLGRR